MSRTLRHIGTPGDVNKIYDEVRFSCLTCNLPSPNVHLVREINVFPWKVTLVWVTRELANCTSLEGGSKFCASNTIATLIFSTVRFSSRLLLPPLWSQPLIIYSIFFILFNCLFGSTTFHLDFLRVNLHLFFFGANKQATHDFFTQFYFNGYEWRWIVTWM